MLCTEQNLTNRDITIENDYSKQTFVTEFVLLSVMRWSTHNPPYPRQFLLLLVTLPPPPSARSNYTDKMREAITDLLCISVRYSMEQQKLTSNMSVELTWMLSPMRYCYTSTKVQIKNPKFTAMHSNGNTVIYNRWAHTAFLRPR